MHEIAIVDHIYHREVMKILISHYVIFSETKASPNISFKEKTTNSWVHLIRLYDADLNDVPLADMTLVV